MELIYLSKDGKTGLWLEGDFYTIRNENTVIQMSFRVEYKNLMMYSFYVLSHEWPFKLINGLQF